MLHRRRRTLRCLAVISILSAIAACDGSPVAPAPHVRSPQAALHDDTPPDTPCLSGWMSVNGLWVCDDPGI